MGERKRVWHVGFRDRGHGHGDFAVLDESGVVVAKVETGLLSDASVIAAAPILLAFAGAAAESLSRDDCECGSPDDRCGRCRALDIIRAAMAERESDAAPERATGILGGEGRPEGR